MKTPPSKNSEPETSTEEEKPPEEPPISRQDYQALVDEREQLKAKLAEYQRQSQQQQPPSQQPSKPQSQPQFQPPQFQITPENSAKISEAITAEAMAFSGKKKLTPPPFVLN